jgi:hypothetical protein
VHALMQNTHTHIPECDHTAGALPSVTLSLNTTQHQQDYIILCLEDSSDWNNATTRRTVMQVR